MPSITYEQPLVVYDDPGYLYNGEGAGNVRSCFSVAERLVYVRPDGLVYPLHAPPVRVVMSEEGFGTPPMRYVTDTAPFQHGDTVRFVQLMPRPVQLVIMQNFISRSDYRYGRQLLLDTLRPNRSPDGSTTGKLLYYLADGSKRQLDVWLDGGPGFAPRQGGWREWSFTEALRFVAHDPVWYDPTVNTEVFLQTASGSLVFPATFPITFGSMGKSSDVSYRGTWVEYPSFVITGPITNPTLYNNSLGLKLELDYALLDGQSITITLRNQKTITLNDGTNLLNYLTSDSDLTTFALAPDPQAPDGVNQIVVAGSDTTSDSSASMTYHNRYFGI